MEVERKGTSCSESRDEGAGQIGMPPRDTAFKRDAASVTTRRPRGDENGLGFEQTELEVLG